MVQGLILFSDSSRGITIPQFFAKSVQRNYVYGINEEDLDWFLSNDVDHIEYWDRWDEILNNCYIQDHDNNTWYLSQDGDLWLFNEEAMTEEEKENFFGQF
mgnify:CR=1 FL=1